MNLERLHEILRETTIPVRKGPVRREEERAGLRVVHIDDMPAADDPALEGMEMVDVHFIEVAIDRNAAEHHKAELVEILREYPRLAAGPSYIEVGGEIGDQGAALRLFGLGEALGFWKVVTPERIGIKGEAANQLAGSGFIMVSGFAEIVGARCGSF